MSHFLSCLVFAIGGAIVTGILVDLKWKEAAKKLLDKLAALQEGLNAKSSEINNLNVKLIASNARINMFEVTLCEKDKEINELSKKVKESAKTGTTPEVTPVTTQHGLTKKRGPYKKKKNYGRPASNNNSGKKAE